MAVDTKKSSTKYWINFIIVVVIMFSFGYIPPFGGLSADGVRLLGVFIGLLYGMVAVGNIEASILAIIAVGLVSDVTWQGYMAQGFANQTFLMIMFTLFIAEAMRLNGSCKVLMEWLMSRKICEGRGIVMCIMFYISLFVIGLMVGALIGVVLSLAFYRVVMEECDIKPADKFNAVFLGGCLLAIFYGNALGPFKATYALVNAVFIGAGLELPPGAYTVAMLVLSILSIAFYLICAKLIMRVNFSVLNNKKMNNGKVEFKKEQVISLAVMFATMILLIFSDFFPNNFLSAIIKSLGTGGTFMVAFFVLAIWKVDGKEILDIKVCRNGMQWELLFWLLP